MFKNKFLTVLLSAGIAFALWMYVITVVSPGSTDTYYNIPVNLRNESVLHDRGLILTSSDALFVNMELSGNRTDLAKITKDNITLVADLSTIYEPGTQTVNYSYSFPGNVANDAITVLDRSPSKITLTVEQMISKSVPINLVYEGKLLSDDYIVDKDNVILTDMQGTEIEDGKVDVTGPKSVIDQITQAVITVDLTDRSTSFSANYRYTLCDKAGKPVDAQYVTTDVGEISLTLYIQQVKEIPLKLEIISGGGATEETSQIEFEPKTIKISGSESALALIDELVLGTINLGEMTEDQELTFPIELPAGITNRTGLEEITVTIKFPELLMKTFTVTQITPVGVPAGYEADVVTQALPVTVRGPRELVEKMTEKDITINVDFSGEQPGTFTASANVTMDTAYSSVGAIGTYSVSATLREAKGK